MEKLLLTVEGVDSLRIVPDGQGGIEEIHVLSASELSAKQVVRNIESALLAQFGLQVDHRKISVAQVKAAELPLRAAEKEELLAAAPHRRLLLEGFHMERKAGHRVVCRVELRNGKEVYEGAAEGPDYSKSRLEVAGRAVLNALIHADGEGQLALEGVAALQRFGHPLVVVVIQGREGRRTFPLPGIARIDDSPEEAVVLACLAATNRWMSAPAEY